jgi:hypothetical protein
MRDQTKLIKALRAVGATPVQVQMAAILYAVNGLADALAFVAKIPTFGAAPPSTPFDLCTHCSAHNGFLLAGRTTGTCRQPDGKCWSCGQ